MKKRTKGTRKRTKKYKVGEFWYMKRVYKGLKENERVMIVDVNKKGKDYILKVKDIDQNVVTNVSGKMLRKHPR